MWSRQPRVQWVFLVVHTQRETSMPVLVIFRRRRRVLPSGEWRWVGLCAVRPVKVRKKRDRQTDGRTPDIILMARRDQRNKSVYRATFRTFDRCVKFASCYRPTVIATGRWHVVEDAAVSARGFVAPTTNAPTAASPASGLWFMNAIVITRMKNPTQAAKNNTIFLIKQVLRSSLLSGQNNRWPRRTLTVDESCWVCAACSI